MKINKYIIKNWTIALTVIAYFLTGAIVAFYGCLNQDLYFVATGSLFFIACYGLTILEYRGSAMLRKITG